MATETRILAEAVGVLLTDVDGFCICGSGTNTENTVLRIQAMNPTIVLIDASRIGAISMADAVAKSTVASTIVAFAIPESQHHITRLAQTGVRGYVLQDASSHYLLDTIELAARGQFNPCPRVATMLLASLTSSGREDNHFSDRLTPRETDVLSLLEDGCSNKEIARRLNVEIQTVKNHVHRILAKLRVNARGEAVAASRRAAAEFPIR